MKNITVRNMLESDIDEVYRIRTDPLVAPNQFPILDADLPETWRQRITGNNVQGQLTICHSTILVKREIVGDIIQTHYTVDETKYVSCGWNLAPNYWGQGIMQTALRMKISELFHVDGVGHIFSECFRNNARCIRLLQRLGYIRQAMPIYDRIVTSYNTKCLRWILRFRLDATQWSPPKSPADSE